MNEPEETILEYERTALSALMLDNGRLIPAKIAELRSTLTCRKHAVIADALALMSARREPITLITVADSLRKSATLDAAGGLSYVANLSGLAPSSANIDFYLGKIREAWEARATKHAALLLSEAIDKGAPADEARATAQESLRRIGQHREARKPFADRLAAKIEADEAREPGTLLGLPLSRFADMARELDGIQPGLYLVGAHANVGKSALLSNIALDVLQASPEASVLYFSMDDTGSTTIDRMVAILAYDSVQKSTGDAGARERGKVAINSLRHKIHDPELRRAKAEAVRVLSQYAEAGRLDVLDRDDSNDARGIEAVIEGRARPGAPLVVIVDALYNVDTGEDWGGLREANIARANWLQAIGQRYNLTIICSSELRKRNTTGKPTADEAPTLDDLMESGKYSYAANVVMLLYPEDRAMFYEGQRRDGRHAAPDCLPPRLIIDFAKNKLSSFRGKMAVGFTRRAGHMSLEGPVKTERRQEKKPETTPIEDRRAL